MGRLIAYATGDWHLHNWAQHNKEGYRINVAKDFIRSIYSLCSIDSIPLLFTGDMFHTPNTLSNCVLNEFLPELKWLSDRVKIIAITGNHDTDGKYSYIRMIADLFPGIQCIDDNYVMVNEGLAICGIGYKKHNIGFFDKVKSFPVGNDCVKILMVHQDLPGAKDPSGFEIEDISGMPRNIYKNFKEFNWVLSGHIHKPQQLSKNTFMLGAPYQQRVSDMGCDMGVWEIYDTKEPQFISLPLPEFKYYSNHDDKDDFHYWVEKPMEEENNEKEREVSFKNHKNTDELAIKYMSAAGIDNKEQLKALQKSLKNAL